MLTAGQAKYAAFKREVAKLAGIVDWVKENPITTTALTQGAMGGYSLARHGPWGPDGMSNPEAKSKQKLMALPQEPIDEESKKELRKALAQHRSNVLSAEMAGAGLGLGGITGAGVLTNRFLLGPSLEKGERGLSTTTEDLSKMYDYTKQRLTDKYHLKGEPPDLLTIPGGGIESGRNVPKGGLMPKFLRKWEAGRNADVFANSLQAHGYNLPPDELKAESKRLALEAIKGRGAIAAPMGVGPHISAHEFGHTLFGASTPGKVVRALRIPGVGGALAGSLLASTSDPDSTQSKLAPLISAAGVAPIIGEEAMASRNALKVMKNTGFSPEQLSKARRQLGKAFGTYAVGLGVPIVAAPYLIRKLRQYNQARRAEKGLDSPGELAKRIEALEE